MRLWSKRVFGATPTKTSIPSVDRVARSDAGWRIELDSEVTRVSIDHALSLLLWSEGERYADVRIGCGFRLHSRSGIESWNGDRPEELGRFARLFGQKVAAIDMADGGTLEILFGNGERLVVLPNPDYESFELGVDGWRFIGRPCEGLIEFEPTPAVAARRSGRGRA